MKNYNECLRILQWVEKNGFKFVRDKISFRVIDLAEVKGSNDFDLVFHKSQKNLNDPYLTSRWRLYKFKPKVMFGDELSRLLTVIGIYDPDYSNLLRSIHKTLFYNEYGKIKDNLADFKSMFPNIETLHNKGEEYDDSDREAYIEALFNYHNRDEEQPKKPDHLKIVEESDDES